MLRILGRASSINVRKVLWTCREIGIDYRREDYGTGFAPTNTPQFLAMNPNGQVPVIEDEEGVLWESNTICRYLAAKHGRTDLLPATARERARVEQWMDWGATDLNMSWRYAFIALIWRDPNGAVVGLVYPAVPIPPGGQATYDAHSSAPGATVGSVANVSADAEPTFAR